MPRRVISVENLWCVTNGCREFTVVNMKSNADFFPEITLTSIHLKKGSEVNDMVRFLKMKLKVLMLKVSNYVTDDVNV